MAQCEEGTDGEWVDVEFDSINVGDRVRGRFEDEEDGSARRTWSEGVVSRKLDHALQLEGFSYYYDSSRTWQRLTPATVAPRAGSWVQVLSSRRLRSGERARGESRTSGQVREGVVREVTHQGHVMFEGQTAAAGSSRRWSRWVPAPEVAEPALPAATWERVRPEDMAVGDIVKTQGDTAHWGCDVPEGAFQSLSFNYVYVDAGAGGGGWDAGRTWFRRVTAPEGEGAVTWLPVIPEQINVGDYVRGVDGGRESWAPLPVEGVVDRIDVENDSIRLAGDYEVSGSVLRVRDWTRRVTAPVAATPQPPSSPAITAPQVGDRFNRTYARAERATRENCEATRVAPRREGGWIVRYSWGGYNYTSDVSADGFITSGVAGRYELVSSAPAVESRPATSTPLPEWAVGLTLEQARKYIHDEARRLYRRGSNCHSGTRDFLRAARLPSDPDRAYPEPQAVDESERVRAFLAGVRLDALSTAEDHGKSISEVEGYLTAIGLTAPRPAHEDHTVNIRVPIGANVTQVLRDLGWEVR